ncbi:hypothetical protein SEUCBS139899_007563 [Sporothrix eucalyptigena]|uniref:FAD-binding domain-containing protein n=1 Tax=Sporothrix eucalyptigena TaxID=1812306 RepID=A0ABP0CCC3_9PEZI
MPKTYDVIVAGAGPIGLFLAGELALAGASVLVLERETVRDGPLKAAPLGFRGINTLTLECLTRRGLLDAVFPADKANLKGMMKPKGSPHGANGKGGGGPGGPGGPPASTRPFRKTEGMQFGGHFAGMFFNANQIDLGRWKYRVNGPGMVPGPTTMATTEAAYGERADKLGVEVLRGHTLTEIVEGTEEDSEQVTVKVMADDIPKEFAARWLVGCDGGQSVVRRTAGFRVEGSEPKFTGYAMRCDLENAEKLKPGFVVTDSGMYIAGAFGDTVYLMDADGGTFDRRNPDALSKDHLQSVLTRVTGDPNVKITELRIATSFTDRCRHAMHYRRGRVLLAGDAAHTHATFGAQGMNLGMGDAMNLGWKLGATIRREAKEGTVDTSLLDTYDAERLPVAEQVLEMSRAQSMAFYPDVYGKAVRSMFQRTINTVDGTNLFISLFWGLSQKYDLGKGQHPLVGLSAPDFVLDGKDENSDDSADSPRLNHKLVTAHGLLVDLAEDGNKTLEDLAGTACRVDYLAAPAVAAKRGLQAFLVRPDGIVAWAVDEGEVVDEDSLKAAMTEWFAC